MRAERSRVASGQGRAVSAALFALLLASCTSDPALQMSSPGYNMSGTEADGAPSGALADTAPSAPLPDQVAFVPAANPAAPAVASSEPKPADPATAAEDVKTAALATPAAPPPAEKPAIAEKPVNERGAAAARPEAKTSAEAKPVADTAPDEATVTAALETKKRGFLSSFFATPANGQTSASGNSQRGAPFSKVAASPKAPSAAAETQPVIETIGKPQPVIENTAKPQPLLQLASAADDDTPVAKPLAVHAAASGDFDELPGVRQSALFEIKRKSGLDDDSDVDLHEDELGEGPIQLASAAGMARLAPNGLLTQTESVDVACLKPSLVRVLKTVEQHYGKKIIVTSGYRSPEHNRRARGAKNSLHMYCAAADVQISGVSKWELANYVRTMPGRGGVGTYCHTNSVHIDVGPERDWNWRCRRSST